MTPDEIQAIREKHYLWKDRECNYDGEPYPCDAIKVLDAWEADNDYWTQIANGTLPEMEVTECDHQWVHRAGSGYRANPVEFCAKCDTVRRSCPKCGEETTEERKFSDLETEVEHPDISASSSSDTLPESECNHRTDGLLPEPDGTLEIIEFDFCPKCGEKL